MSLGWTFSTLLGFFLTSGIFYFPKGSRPTFPVTRSRNEVKPNGRCRWTVKGFEDYKVFQVHLRVRKFTGVLADSSKSLSLSAASPLSTESTSDRHSAASKDKLCHYNKRLCAWLSLVYVFQRLGQAESLQLCFYYLEAGSNRYTVTKN